MISIIFKPSLLLNSSFNSSSFYEFKCKTISPAKSHPYSISTAKYGATYIKACSLSAISNDDDPGSSRLCFSNRRRTLSLLSTLPFFLTSGSFGVDAVVLDDTNSFSLIKGEVRKIMSKGKAAGVLRLVFHDAGTFETTDNLGGMNGSIILELDRPENAGLKKSVKILEKAKREVDAVQSVSWADMIAVAGAEAVSLCGGPTIPVLIGRVDSIEPDPEGKLPEEFLDALALKECFQRKGITTQELVALSGAHTLGNKGFGNPTIFDNSYYRILLEKPWKSSGSMTSMIGLPSDRALVEDDECLRWIKTYADNQDIFFEDFKSAYCKLVNSGAKWKSL